MRGQTPRITYAAVLLGLVALALAFYHQDVTTFVEQDTEHLVGVYHLHSDASHDSRVPQARYVQAAQQRNLDFIVLTDHNAQAEPRPRSGTDDVCVIASAELSTPFGHVINLGARALVPPDARDGPQVLAAIKAQGGRAIIAHPTDIKRPWTGPYPDVGGMEIANWSASARRRAAPFGLRIPAVLVAWLVNTPLALSQVYDRDDKALALWDAPEHAALAGFCGIDAHGWIAPRDNVLGWQLVLDTTRRQTPVAAQGHAIMQALQAGHFYCAAGVLGRAPAFVFAAYNQARRVGGHGDVMVAGSIDRLVVHAPSTRAGQLRMVVRRNGEVIYDAQSSAWSLETPPTGIYRVELWAGLPKLISSNTERSVPVLYSNKLTLTD